MNTRIAIAFTLVAVFPSLGMTAEPVIEKDIVYASPGGTDLKFDFARPDGEGPFPLVVLVHGGGWRQGSRTEFADGQKAFAGFGFATAAVQYRLTPKHQFPAQLDDVTAAIMFLAENKKKFRIDPDRVGLMGGSAGGHLVLLTGFTPAKGYTIRAIINVCGPTDLRNFQSTEKGDAVLKAGAKRDSAGLLEDLLGTADRKAEVYAKASPITLVNKNVPPVMTIHGTADDLVPISQADDLHAALKKAGVTEKLIRIEGANHDFGGKTKKESDAALVAAIAFIGKHLKKD